MYMNLNITYMLYGFIYSHFGAYFIKLWSKRVNRTVISRGYMNPSMISDD